MDALDRWKPREWGLPVPGSITYRESPSAHGDLADSKELGSMDLVEISPILDVANKTAKLAVELTLSRWEKAFCEPVRVYSIFESLQRICRGDIGATGPRVRCRPMPDLCPGVSQDLSLLL